MNKEDNIKEKFKQALTSTIKVISEEYLVDEKLKKNQSSKKFDFFELDNLNNKYDLDGDVSWNTARLINHSCVNNCDYEGQGLKLWVVAIKDIKKGEELTCDYGFGYDSDYKQFPCNCGSKNCVGYIVREGSRWRINKKFKKTQRINR